MAEASDGVKRRLPDHPLIPRDEPQLITTAEELEAFFEHAATHGCFAYDTEFIGELSYFPKLCLIQLGTIERVALVDPFTGISLDPIWRGIADPALQTIVHAGAQDLEPVVRHLDRAPANVFDTQLAGGFVNLPAALGLSKMVRELLGIRLGKGLTFTNWDHRPLSDVHLHYAADDVRFLPAVYAEIRKRLDDYGHAAWAAEESAGLSDVAQYTFDADLASQRVRGSGGLGTGQFAVLRELVKLRDQAAREHDVPPRTLIKDDVMTTLVRNPPRDAAELAQVSGLPRPVRQSYGEAIVGVTAAAADAPARKRNKGGSWEESAADRQRIDSLSVVIKGLCYSRCIDPKLVCSRADIVDYVRACRGHGDKNDLKITRGWRGELLGSFLDRFLAGETDLTLKWADDALRAGDR